MPCNKKKCDVTLTFESKTDAEGFIAWWTENGGQELSNFRTVLPETVKKDGWRTTLRKTKLIVLRRAIK